MTRSFKWSCALPWVFWICALTAIVTWALQSGYVVGWDLNVYKAALFSLKAGHDPYADAMAIQRVYHAQGPHPPGTAVPFSYVYSPITLPLLSLAGRCSLLLVATVYWMMYVAAVLATLWAGWTAVEERERAVFALLVPLAVFFPGLLQQDVIFSGNVAYILYGAVLAGAAMGWRRGNWLWFYAAVVAASCFKAPLLSLVVIAPLSARRQWVWASASALVGVGLFAMQPHVWPVLFRHYMEAVELQFSFNRDFSSSPAGLAANAMFGRALYPVVSGVAYLLYGAPVFLLLLWFSRRFFAGKLSLRQWVPVLLVGVILLNPRIMEYDVAPIVIPMALVAWRFFFARGQSYARAGWGLAVLFAVVNTVAAHPFAETTWRPTEGSLLLALFAAGVWTLWRQVQQPATLAAAHAGEAALQ